jgi:hypothetical protein
MGVRDDESVSRRGTSRAERVEELILEGKKQKQVFESCGLHSNEEVVRAVRE